MPRPSPCCNLRTPVTLLALLLLAPTAQAHPEGLSGLRLLVWSDHARAVLTVHTRDMSNWFPPRQNPDYVPDVCRAMAAAPTEILELRADDAPITPTHVTATCPEVGLIKLELDYPLPTSPAPATLLIWSKELPQLPRGHQQVLQADDMRGQPPTAEQGHYLKDDTLDVEHDSAEFDFPTGPIPPPRPSTQLAVQQSPKPPANAVAASPPEPDPAPWPLLALAAVPVLLVVVWQSRRRRGTFTPPIS